MTNNMQTVAGIRMTARLKFGFNEHHFQRHEHTATKLDKK